MGGEGDTQYFFKRDLVWQAEGQNVKKHQAKVFHL